MSWRRTCAGVSLLQFEERECEKDEIKAEKWSPLPNGRLVVGFILQVTLLLKSILQVRILGNWHSFRIKLGSGCSKISWVTLRVRKAQSNKEVIRMMITRLDTGVANKVQCLGRSKKRGGNRQKEYADKYERILGTATRQ